jgi:hypothetical protein
MLRAPKSAIELQGRTQPCTKARLLSMRTTLARHLIPTAWLSDRGGYVEKIEIARGERGNDGPKLRSALNMSVLSRRSCSVFVTIQSRLRNISEIQSDLSDWPRLPFVALLRSVGSKQRPVCAEPESVSLPRLMVRSTLV